MFHKIWSVFSRFIATILNTKLNILTIIFWTTLIIKAHGRFVFFSLSNIFILVYNLTMNRLTNEQRLQTIEFYYQNPCSIKKVHRALLPFHGQYNRPATVR